jgi:hypothetical protein
MHTKDFLWYENLCGRDKILAPHKPYQGTNSKSLSRTNSILLTIGRSNNNNGNTYDKSPTKQKMPSSKSSTNTPFNLSKRETKFIGGLIKLIRA